MPCPVPLHCSHITDYVDDLRPLPGPDVGPSVLICDVDISGKNYR